VCGPDRGQCQRDPQDTTPHDHLALDPAHAVHPDAVDVVRLNESGTETWTTAES
jgi:hypothetical protein